MEHLLASWPVLAVVLPAVWAIIKWEISRHVTQDNEQDKKLASIERDYVSQRQLEDALRRVEDSNRDNFARLHQRLDDLYKLLMARVDR